MISLISILQRLVANVTDLGVGALGVFAVLAVVVLSGAGGHVLELIEQRTNGSR